MAAINGYALRLPASIMDEVKKAAEDEGSSINQFIVVAVARRLAELKAMKYFETRVARVARVARADPAAFQRVLAKAGTLPPQDGDELPKGWLDAQ